MAVAFRLPSRRPLDLVGFAWSPLFEAVLSLPVVVYPKRAPIHLPWSRRCRELPAELLSEIMVLARTFDGYVPGCFEVGLAGDQPAMDTELAAFIALDDDIVAHEVSLALGGLHCGPPIGNDAALVHQASYRDAVIDAAATKGPDQADLARAVFEDPGAVKVRYARMLEWYWDAAFREEWERLLPRIENEVTDGSRALVSGGMPGLVAELLPEGRWDEESSSLIVDKTWQNTCDVAERGGMLFVPSNYGWPRVLIELARPWPVSVFIPLRDLRQPEVPRASDHEVADGLRALGEETRLQIARMVADEPRSTKEIAELIRLSDSAISRHLKILEAAGIVTGQRDGYFVLYRLRPDRIGQLSAALNHTLGIAEPNTGAMPQLPVRLVQRG